MWRVVGEGTEIKVKREKLGSEKYEEDGWSGGSMEAVSNKAHEAADGGVRQGH